MPQLCGSEEDGNIYGPGTSESILFTQSELNDLVIDLRFSKNSAEVSGFRLKGKNLVSGR